MILPVDPVVLQQREIEIEAAARSARLPSARAENATGASPDGAPSPFCVAAVNGVGAPGRRRRPACAPSDVTASTIVSAPSRARDRGTFRDRIQHARRRLGVDHRHQVGRRVASAARAAPDRRRGPIRLDARDRRRRSAGASAPGDRRNIRSRRRPRARRARAGSRPPLPCPTCRCPTSRAQNDPRAARNAGRAGPDVVEDRHHLGIEMAEDGRRHRAHHARCDGARSRARAAACPPVASAEVGSACGIEKCPDLSTDVSRQRDERRARIAAARSRTSHRRLQARDAEAGRDRAARAASCRRCRARASRGVRRGRRRSSRGTAPGRSAGHGEDCALRAGAQRGVTRRAPHRQHGEPAGHRRGQIGELRAVGAGLLHADDVGMRRKPRRRSRAPC